MRLTESFNEYSMELVLRSGGPVVWCGFAKGGCGGKPDVLARAMNFVSRRCRGGGLGKKGSAGEMVVKAEGVLEKVERMVYFISGRRLLLE